MPFFIGKGLFAVILWSMQDSSHRQNAQQWKNTGIIEGWYGDGNFARTSIMHNLWKSKGTYLQPWNSEIKLGAEMKGDTLYMAVESAGSWEGKLFFDKARHATVLNLPIDWPRINQFSEWFTIDPSLKYQLIDVQKGTSQELAGESLLKGMALKLEANEAKWFMLLSL